MLLGTVLLMTDFTSQPWRICLLHAAGTPATWWSTRDLQPSHMQVSTSHLSSLWAFWPYETRWDIFLEPMVEMVGHQLQRSQHNLTYGQFCPFAHLPILAFCLNRSFSYHIFTQGSIYRHQPDLPRLIITGSNSEIPHFPLRKSLSKGPRTESKPS